MRMLRDNVFAPSPRYSGETAGERGEVRSNVDKRSIGESNCKLQIDNCQSAIGSASRARPASTRNQPLSPAYRGEGANAGALP